MRFIDLAQPGIQGLAAYDPGHDIVALRRRFAASTLVELGSNENPHGASPRAHQALVAALSELNRYPDPLGGDLKCALAEHLGLERTQLFLGNGSHELVMLIAQVFAGPALEVLAAQYGFTAYALAAQAAGAEYVAVPALPVDAAMPRGHDLDAILARITPRTRLIYLANPNNPTGTWFTTAALDAFVARVPRNVLVVVDEAYIEYVTDPALVSSIALLEKYRNLIVLRTFSKAHGLAGLRVGYACADPELLQVLERPRESFNVNGAGLAACTAALHDLEHIRHVRIANRAERIWLAQHLTELGLHVTPSQTNFLLADFGCPAAPLEADLMARGVVVRPMRGYGLTTCIRITVGTRAENLRLLAALEEVLAVAAA